MSTTTNFKRIALVAVAALGLGVLSSVPSQATVSGTPVLTVGNGTATKGKADTTSAATVTLSWTASTTDTVVITAAQKAGPTSNTTNAARFYFVDTVGAFAATRSDLSITDGNDSKTASTGTLATSAAGNNVVNLRLQLDSTTARSAGTYTYTITATPYDANANGGTRQDAKSVTADVSITIAALASESKVADASKSQLVLSSATTYNSNYGDADSVVAVAATAGSTVVGTAALYLQNAAGSPAQESLTVTIDKGLVSTVGGTKGRSLSLVWDSTDYSNGYKIVEIYADGTAGTATLTLSTPSVTKTKSINFYSTTVSSITAKSLKTVVAVGSPTSVISGVAKDSAGLVSNSATAVYAYSSDTTVVQNNGTACTFSTTLSAHTCDLVTLKAGKVKITLRNKSTLATSTVASDAIDLTVSASPAATVKLAFDKTTYAPGEKAKLSVSVLDADGVSLPEQQFANLFATGGITFSTGMGSISDTTTAISVTTATSAKDGIATPVFTYTVYMPVTGGTLTATATGGVSLAKAGQVATTATATVTDSGSAALAAVTALAATVASLRTLIVTLTNLVLKIQKKVKA